MTVHLVAKNPSAMTNRTLIYRNASDTKLSFSNLERTVKQERTTVLFKFETCDLSNNSRVSIVSCLLIHSSVSQIFVTVLVETVLGSKWRAE